MHACRKRNEARTKSFGINALTCVTLAACMHAIHMHTRSIQLINHEVKKLNSLLNWVWPDYQHIFVRKEVIKQTKTVVTQEQRLQTKIVRF